MQWFEVYCGGKSLFAVIFRFASIVEKSKFASIVVKRDFRFASIVKVII